MHHTGHGVGFRYHELTPFIAPQSEDVLTQGMVVTIEPGIYIEGFGGIRFESNVWVEQSKGLVLD